MMPSRKNWRRRLHQLIYYAAVVGIPTWVFWQTLEQYGWDALPVLTLSSWLVCAIWWIVE